jgi:hypothetical protein
MSWIERPDNASAEQERELRSAEYSSDRIDSNTKSSFIPSEFGLCAKCTNFAYIKTALESESYRCTHHSLEMFVRVSRRDPIRQCSGFYERGQMDLDTMFKMATLIEVDEKRKVGF